MTSWLVKAGVVLSPDRDTRSLDAAPNEDPACVACGVTPIRDVADYSHTFMFGMLLGVTYPPEEGVQRVLTVTLYDDTDTFELRWPGRSSTPRPGVDQ